MAVLGTNSVSELLTLFSNANGFNDVVKFNNASAVENGKLCRAFVRFNGSGTISILSSFNVSSITDNATSDYTVNFSEAMVDANFAVVIAMAHSANFGDGNRVYAHHRTSTTGSARLEVLGGAGEPNTFDAEVCSCVIFR